eukprot:gnl/Chilomastix_caulleri/6775.p2 GENE.gnl/Chilomastix_caulleri/6775~~gnl/Chilomastix_caulleri/6775.p2  ORF type:complete len:54 (-),score=0.10 gnl/Chilomastix_caulleri/6775:74-235(-)
MNTLFASMDSYCCVGPFSSLSDPFFEILFECFIFSFWIINEFVFHIIQDLDDK